MVFVLTHTMCMCPGEDRIKQMLGPGTQEQWLKWKHLSPEQRSRGSTMRELEKLIMVAEVVAVQNV